MKNDGSREQIIKAASELIGECGGAIDTVTVRDIAKRAGVGLGLVNYYFGKDELIELCVERIVNGIVGRFVDIRENVTMSPLEKLYYLGNMTLDFLFDNRAVSEISMLSDYRAPKAGDNTDRTYNAYLPLVAACRPDLDGEAVARRTFALIAAMQSMFLRRNVIKQIFGVELCDRERRMEFHNAVVRDILGLSDAS